MARCARISRRRTSCVRLDVNRSRGDVLSCAFVVLTLTAAETQLTKGFSLSPAATPRHSAVASGKATDFPSTRAMCEEGWRASMLPTTTATTLSATTSIPRTSGGSAAPAVLQKLGHPHPPLRVLSPRMVHANTCAFLPPPYMFRPSIYLFIYPFIYLFIYLCIYPVICPSIYLLLATALSTRDTFFPLIDAIVELHYR